MVGQWTIRGLLFPAMLICSLAFVVADPKIETCANGASSTCKQRTVTADYGPEEEEEEENIGEDVHDLDEISHMQTRVNIDRPADSEETAKSAKAPEVAAPSKSELPAGLQEPVAAQFSLLEIGEVDQPAVGPESPASEPQAGVFLTGSQLLVGAGVGAILVILGAVLATVFRTWLKERKGASRDELKAAGKAWILEWALGYEPEPDDDEEVVNPTEMKLRNTKKAPPVHTASDSGDTDEEEPEAESDSQMECDLLQNAVFVAQQVEAANEAMDRGYGIEMDTRLSNVIQQMTPDLR